MIKVSDTLPVTVNENMRGGSGSISMSHLADKADMLGKSRLFARITLKPGCSIGWHVHENEMEIYHILSGMAAYDDNGEPKTASAGDTTLTPPGHGHAVANAGDTDLVFIALIILA